MYTNTTVLDVFLFIAVSYFCLFVYLSTFLFGCVYMPVSLSVHLFTGLHVCLYGCLFVFHENQSAFLACTWKKYLCKIRDVKVICPLLQGFHSSAFVNTDNLHQRTRPRQSSFLLFLARWNINTIPFTFTHVEGQVTLTRRVGVE